MGRRLQIVSHLHRYAVYRRALISYLVLSALTVFVVSATLFAAFGSRSVQDINESGLAILTQTGHAMDLLKEQVRTVGNALIKEQVVVASLRAKDVNRLREYQTNLVFNEIRTVYPFIRFIGLYDRTTDRYVNTEGLTSDRERAFLQWISDDGPKLFFSSFVRPIDYAYPRASDTGTVVSFVLRPDLRLQQEDESFILVNVELEYVEDLISNFSGTFSGNVLVASDDGSVVVDGTGGRLSEPAFMHRLLAAARESGTDSTFSLSFDGRRYVVTHARAPELGWNLFGVRPLKDVLSNSFALAWLALGTAAVILLLGVLVSIAFTKKIYDPLSQLVDRVENSDIDGMLEPAQIDRINEFEILGQVYARFAERVGLLEGALDRDLQLLRVSYVHSLLTGAASDQSDDPDIVRRIVAETDAPQYAVVLCRIDRLGELRGARVAATIANSLLLVSRLHHDALADLGIAIPLLLENDEIAVLVGGKHLSTNGITARLRESQVRISDTTGLTVSCSVSHVVTGRAEVRNALLDARRTLRYRFFTGPSSVVSARAKNDPTGTFIPFPSRLCRRLIESVRLNRRDEAADAMAEIRESVNENSYQGALAVYYQLSAELMSEFDYLKSRAPEAFATHRAFIEDLSGIEFAADADRAMWSLCEAIMDALAADAADKTEILIRDTESYVHAHYTDPNLSLDSVATAMQVSAGHLGRVFAEHRDTYLREYISEVRISQARKMLTDTDLTVQTIAEAVGIANSTYFFTLFRKFVGTTPARYRRSVGHA